MKYRRKCKSYKKVLILSSKKKYNNFSKLLIRKPQALNFMLEPFLVLIKTITTWTITFNVFLSSKTTTGVRLWWSDFPKFD